MTGALPPSSRCVRLIDFDAASSTFWPVAIEPVSDSMATSGWLISALPVVCAAADDDVEDALRKDLGDERGELQRRQRRHLRRLQHHRVAGHQRRADLPHRHHQRIVPRRDRADDADRVAADHRGEARQVFRRGACRDDARRAGEEAQAIDDRRHLVVLHRVDRLAAVQRLELGEGLPPPPRCGRRASASAPRAAPASCATSSRRPSSAAATACVDLVGRRLLDLGDDLAPVFGLMTGSASPLPFDKLRSDQHFGLHGLLLRPLHITHRIYPRRVLVHLPAERREAAGTHEHAASASRSVFSPNLLIRRRGRGSRSCLRAIRDDIRAIELTPHFPMPATLSPSRVR